MSSFSRRLLLLLLLLLAAPALAGERLQAVVRDLHVNSYAANEDAVRRLQAVEDRPGADAPLVQRQTYYAALGDLAGRNRKPEMLAIAEDARKHLQKMADDEGCKSCALDAQLTGAQAALSRGDIDVTTRLLAEAASAEASDAQELWRHLLRAFLYRQRGLFNEGVAEALSALKLANKLGYRRDQVDALNFLMLFNAYLGNYARAEAAGKEAYALAERMGARRMMADTLLSLGFVYAESGRSQELLEAYRRGLVVAGNTPGTLTTRTILLSNLADYWLGRKDFQQALDYAQRALLLAQQGGDALAAAYAQTNAGVAKAHLGDVEGGLADLRAAIDTAQREGNPTDVIGVTQELVGILELAQRYREALAELRKIEALQQSVTKQKRDKAVLELQERYDAEKRQREIERLSLANKFKESELATQTAQRYMWGAVAVALGLAAMVLLQGLKRMRNVNRRLSDDVAVLAEQSAHDPLTGSFNRRQGHQLLARHNEASRAAAPGNGPALAVLLLDIDFFKLINDGHGHAAGDAVLIEVVQRLRGLLREQDAVIRWGGEEFLLLLPEVRSSALPMLAESVLQVIAQEPMRAGEVAFTVTASLGCVAAPFGRISDAEELVQLADLALYRAKATGRNRAICVGGAAAELDAAALGQDLAAASAAGKIALHEVVGPHGGPTGAGSA